MWQMASIPYVVSFVFKLAQYKITVKKWMNTHFSMICRIAMQNL